MQFVFKVSAIVSHLLSTLCDFVLHQWTYCAVCVSAYIVHVVREGRGMDCRVFFLFDMSLMRLNQL